MSDATDEPTTAVGRDEVVGVAYAALMAAVLLRDMADAMPPEFLIGMPADIRDRMMMTCYQDCFDQLPENIRTEARAQVMADPAVVAARAVDVSTR